MAHLQSGAMWDRKEEGAQVLPGSLPLSSQ